MRLEKLVELLLEDRKILKAKLALVEIERDYGLTEQEVYQIIQKEQKRYAKYGDLDDCAYWKDICEFHKKSDYDKDIELGRKILQAGGIYE
jgi:predicted transcriptional regulator